MRKFVLGDVHGGFKALIQCFEKANLDYENDMLICLGDVCDGWPETSLCFDELLKIKHLVYILGNHDDWALNWAKTGEKPSIWLSQGGEATIRSYLAGMPHDHAHLLETAQLYYESENKLFVHAGIKLGVELEQTDKETFIWDRNLVRLMMTYKMQGQDVKLTDHEEVYIGHTPTTNFNFYKPVNSCGVWLMDTGAGWGGPLTIMNVDTKEYYQSDHLKELYPDSRGR